MDFVFVGKLVNTHALKGEVRIVSNFEYKNKIFLNDKYLFIGKDKIKVTIKNYRPHKNFDMCIFKEFDNINEVLKFKGMNVYCIREDLNLKKEELLQSDYITLRCIYKNKTIGYITDVINSNGNKLFEIESKKYVPMNENFIEKVDLENKSIYFKNLEGLI